MEDNKPVRVKPCSDCGETFEAKGKERLCPKCKEEHKKKTAVSSIVKRREWRRSRVAEGKCAYLSTCDNPVVPGHTVCQEHLNYIAERNAERKAELSNIEQTKEVVKLLSPQKLYDPKDDIFDGVSVSEQLGYKPPQPSPATIFDELKTLFKKVERIESSISQLNTEKDRLLAQINERIKVENIPTPRRSFCS